jgi:hypothetical protein
LHQPEGSRKGLNWIEKKNKNTVSKKKGRDGNPSTRSTRQIKA